MERYFYFRDVADEANDANAGTSAMVPVKNITGIGPGTSITELDIWFLSGKNETHSSRARLTVTRGKMKQVTEEITSAMNAGPHHDGVTVIYDAMTTTDGASSRPGTAQSIAARRCSSNITGLAIVSAYT